jgi:hypothetical protein
MDSMKIVKYCCNEATKKLHKILARSKKLTKVATVNTKQEPGFHVTLHQPFDCKDHLGVIVTVTHIIVFYSPDRNWWSYGPIPDGTSTKRIMEGSLIQTSLIANGVVCVPELGYDDTCCFATADNVIDEIIDICNGTKRLERELEHQVRDQVRRQKHKEIKKERRQDPAYALERKEGRKRTNQARKDAMKA